MPLFKRRRAQPADTSSKPTTQRRQDPQQPKRGGLFSRLGRGRVDEAAEQKILGGRDKKGALVPVSEGRRGAPHRVTVHGINDSPEGVAPLTDAARRSGARTSTYAYDDQYRRLGKVGNDFAESLRSDMDSRDGKLIIDAHSMGSRVTLDAMRRLKKSGDLEGRDVELNLIAPPLAGITGKHEGGVNAARLDPTLGILGRLVKGVNPGKDMGSKSPFQKRLDKLELPENVRTQVITGGKDDVVDARDSRFRRSADRLTRNGGTQKDFPEADHSSVVKRAAGWLHRR